MYTIICPLITLFVSVAFGAKITTLCPSDESDIAYPKLKLDDPPSIS